MFFRLPLLALVLASQGLTAQVVLDRTSAAPQTLERFLRTLRSNRVGTLVVLDGEGGFGRKVQELLGHESLVELAVPSQVLVPDKGVGRELRERQGWNESPRWALLDAAGAVKAEGTELPSPQVFAEQLLGAGLVDRGRELENFLAKHLDSVEALDAYLGHRFRVAAARMRPLLKKPDLPANPTPEALRALASAPRELLRPLTDAEDQKIWGATAAALDRLFKRDGWPLGMAGSPVGASWVQAWPDAARHSPLMQGVCRRHLDAVEQVLLRAPSHDRVWRLWVHMAGASGHRGLREVMDRVVMAPGRQETLLPPASVLPDFVRECRVAKDWQALKKTLTPRFEQLQERKSLGDSLAALSLSIPGLEGMRGGGWEDTVDPLVESLLMLGETAQAERLVEEMLTWKSAEGVAAKASAVARRCGQEDLAKRWADLGTK